MTMLTSFARRSSRDKREAHWLRRLQAIVPRAKQRVRLTREEEQELARRWCEERDAQAREKLITSYFGLAVWAASKFRGLGVAMEDLVQEACRALVRAADRFEPGRGVRFTTFAVTWMKGVLRTAIVKRTANLILLDTDHLTLFRITSLDSRHWLQCTSAQQRREA